MIYLLSIILQLTLNAGYTQERDGIDTDLDVILDEITPPADPSNDLDVLLSESLSVGCVKTFDGKDRDIVRLDTSGKRKYALLEKENPPRKYDKDGFLKSRYVEVVRRRNQMESYCGHVCLGGRPNFVGKIFGSNKETSVFKTGDQLEIEFNDSIPCRIRERFVTVNEEDDAIYKISGVLEVLDRAFQANRCVAVVKQTYDVLKRGARVTTPLTFDATAPSDSNSPQTGKVYQITKNRLCLKFKEGKAPRPGTLVYFYNIKDPVTGKEVDPYLIAKGKLVHSSGAYGTAIVTSAKKPVTSETIVSTRL